MEEINPLLARETELEIDGCTYKLKMDLNAQCLFESLTGKSFYYVLSSKDYEATATDERAMFYAMLKANHPEITLEEAGALLQMAPIIRGIRAMREQIDLSQPEAVEGAEAPTEVPTEPTG